MTVDLEVITLTGIHTYKKDKTNIEKRFFPWSEENMPLQNFWEKWETQKQGTREFLSTLLNQDLEPNAPCSCNFLKLNRNQEEHNAPLTNTNNNTLTSVRITLTYKRLRQQQKQKKAEMKSDWNTNSDNRRDNQARKPRRHETTSDWETKIEDDQHMSVECPIKKTKHNTQSTD